MDGSVEKIIEIAGTKHRYQYFIVFIAFFCWFSFELLSVSLSFLEMMPQVTYFLENGTMIPPTKLTYDICKKYNFTKVSVSNASWVTEFDRECNDVETGLIGTFAFFGVLLGALIFQVIAEKLGRRYAILIATFGYIICLITFQFANSIYYLWVLSVFLQIFCSIGNLGSYLLMNEVTSVSSRSLCGAIVQSAFSASGITFIGLYYYLDSWRKPFLIASIIALINGVLYFFFGFESPRFYLNKNRIKDFFATLGKMAKFNGENEKYQNIVMYNYRIVFPENDTTAGKDSQEQSSVPSSSDNSNLEDLIKKNDQDQNINQEIKTTIEKIKEVSAEKQENIKNNTEKQYSALSLLKYSSQRLNFLIMCYMWFCTSGVYYGLTINIKNLPGNTYVTGIIMFVVEAVAYILSGNLINIPFLGRKKTIFMFYSVSFLVYGIIVIFQVESYWLTILSLTARFCVSGVYNIIYTYSTEVYPTVVRSNGLGFNSVCGRVGGMVFPFILEIMHSSITYLFMGLNLIALFAVLLLPETYGKPLSDSIPEENKKIEN